MTPEWAAELLDRNTKNRPVTRRRVDRLVRSIQRGEFKLTHQGIAIDVNGVVQDGGHRLRAIAEAGRPVEIYLATNMPPDNFDVIDTGKGRSPAETLIVSGYLKDPAKLHSLARNVSYYDWTMKVNPMVRWPNPAFRLENVEVRDFVDQHMPGLERYIEMGGSVYRSIRGASQAAAATAMFLIERAGSDRKYTEEFFYGVQTGENLVRSHPIYALRSYLIKKEPNRRGGNVQMELAIWLKAWNDWVKMTPRDIIKWMSSEPMPDVLRVTDQMTPRRAWPT